MAHYSTPTRTVVPKATEALLRIVPSLICSMCAYTGPHQVGTDTGPHHARLVCGACGRYLRWLPKPPPVAQEGQP